MKEARASGESRCDNDCSEAVARYPIHLQTSVKLVSDAMRRVQNDFALQHQKRGDELPALPGRASPPRCNDGQQDRAPTQQTRCPQSNLRWTTASQQQTLPGLCPYANAAWRCRAAPDLEHNDTPPHKTTANKKEEQKKQQPQQHAPKPERRLATAQQRPAPWRARRPNRQRR